MLALAALLASALSSTQEPPPTAIAGRVVDEQHQPVEGVWLLCESTLTADNASAISERDGRFELRTHFTGPHVIRVDARGLEPSDMPRVEAGTRNVEIVLPARAFQTFRVLDDATGKPIELVEIETMAAGSIDWGPITREVPRDYRATPGGLQRVPVPAGTSVWFSVYAAGHAPRGGDVRQDLPDGVPQEVRLRAGAQLRLTANGPTGPLAAADVRLEQIHPRGASPDDRGPIEPEVRVRRTDAQGVFQAGELYGGTYTLRVTAPGLAPLERHELRIEPGQTLDLGMIELRSGGSLCGLVRVPAGADPSRIRLVHEERGQDLPVPIEKDGSFRLLGLGAGEVTLVVPAQERATLLPRRFVFELAQDEMKNVTLDLTTSWPRPLRVRVLDRAKPLEGARVCSRGDAPRLSNWIGETDAQGGASGLIEPGRGAQIVIMNCFGLELDDRGLDPFLAPGAAVEETFELATGSARLEFDADFVAPSNARVRIDFTRSDRPETRPFWTFLRTGEDSLLEKSRLFEGRSIDLGILSPGDYAVRLRFERWEASPGRPGAYRALPERYGASLRVHTGEACSAHLVREP
ncbi:MAG: carboxypeptidase regulatory-like domain-containing protein [Planctomycetes bacterium]|nr:carboxypeptidase regulatory-like domain-containing protein [Planctomycetota bacterium]